MKKLIATLFIALCCITLVGCSGDKTKTDKTEKTDKTDKTKT